VGVLKEKDQEHRSILVAAMDVSANEVASPLFVVDTVPVLYLCLPSTGDRGTDRGRPTVIRMNLDLMSTSVEDLIATVDGHVQIWSSSHVGEEL